MHLTQYRNAFLKINDPKSSGALNASILEWHAQEVNRVGAILQLSVDPVNVGSMPMSVINELADQCKAINDKYKLPIILRYRHEFNGPWLDHGMRPEAFVKSFRDVARAIRSKTNITGESFFNLVERNPYTVNSYDVDCQYGYWISLRCQTSRHKNPL